MDGSTHPCQVEQCGGGVGRNMAEALWRLRAGRVRLITAIGDDADGQHLQNIAPGLLLDGCVVKGGCTASYAAVLDSKGECLLGLGDMDLHSNITRDLVKRHIEVLHQAPLVVLDGNIPQETMDYVLSICDKLQKPVFFEPTDPRKAVKALRGDHVLKFASPNLKELSAMANFLSAEDNRDAPSSISQILQLCKQVSQRIEFLIITVGSRGVITVRNYKNGQLQARLYPVQKLESVLNVSGAGDCFASGFIYGTLLGYKQSICTDIGFQAAKCALLSRSSVPQNVCIDNGVRVAEYKILDLDN